MSSTTPNDIEDHIVSEIRRLADGDAPPTTREFEKRADISRPTVRKRFGSWAKAVEEAGFEPREKRGVVVQYRDSEILNEIRRLADGDEPPTTVEFNEQAEMSVSGVRYRFGSWAKAVEEAGFEPREKGGSAVQYRDSEILNEIRRLADGDEPPTTVEFNEQAEMTVQGVQYRFGSWAKAVEEAGFEPRPPGMCGREPVYSENEALEWIDTFVKEFGVVPRPVEIKGWPGPSLGVYKRIFGSWTEAVRAAGYTPLGERGDV